jgi:hypothetical protein
MAGLKIYRLTPNAPNDDPNWVRALNQGEVIVRARSSGDARIVAAYGEAMALTLKSPIAAETTAKVEISAFRDPRLYHVAEVSNSKFDPEGPRAVLRAFFQVPSEFEPHYPQAFGAEGTSEA